MLELFKEVEEWSASPGGSSEMDNDPLESETTSGEAGIHQLENLQTMQQL